MKKPTFFISEKKFSPKVFTTWFYAWFIIFFSFQNKISQKVFWLCFVFLTMIKNFCFSFGITYEILFFWTFFISRARQNFFILEKNTFFPCYFFSPNRDLYFIWLHTWRIYNCSVDRTFLSHIFLFFVSSRFFLFSFVFFYIYDTTFLFPWLHTWFLFSQQYFFHLASHLKKVNIFFWQNCFYLFIHLSIFCLLPKKVFYLVSSMNFLTS